MKRAVWPAVFFLGLVSLAKADVRLPNVLGDHMVLQRDDAVKLWGWSHGGEQVAITTSWDDHTYNAVATNGGRWEQTISTPAAGGPYSITFAAANTITLRDILIGEVWVCSGQSNMEWSVEDGIDNGEEALAGATQSQIRFFEILRATSNYPQDNCPGEWEVCSPKSFADFSAVAYYFGRHLTEELDGVPIGLIQSAWGGTAAEVWTPAPVIEENEAFQNWQVLGDFAWWPREPSVCYNAMIYPITNYKVAGAIWYQGESNTVNSHIYRDLFPAMIQGWRDAWETPLPFYFVQIAPYDYGRPFEGALLREAQMQALATPLTGMAVINDIGDYYDIHPRNKVDVGKRLANLALNRQYGKAREDNGPLYQGHSVAGNEMQITFTHAEGMSPSVGLSDFTIAGEDRIFFPGDATVKDNQVVVTSEFVPNPIAVRFGFANLTNPNLVNGAGLPASSFRSDDWPILIKPVNITLQYSPASLAYEVKMQAGADVQEIKYTTNGDHPGLFGLTYVRPFFLENDCKIRAIAITDQGPSDFLSEKEVAFNKATFREITYEQQNYSNPFSGGGAQALVDGRSGSLRQNDGVWQGFKNANMSVVIDLGQREEISSIYLQALRNQDDLIFLPNRVAFSISNDGEKYTEVFRKPGFHADDNEVTIEKYAFSLRRERKTRYIKITAECIGKAPSWHDRSGQDAWMMIDEIVVE